MGSKKQEKGWQRVKFGDVVRKVTERVDPEESGLERYVAGGHMQTDDLHIREWGIIGDGYLGPAFHRKFEKGQVLYGSRRTYLRKVAVAEWDGVCANTTYIFEPKDDRLLSDLLPFVMSTESFHTYSVENSRGSVTPYINWTQLKQYEFALPPLEEQRRIADILWAADESIEQFRVCIMKQNTLKKAVMNDLFSPTEMETVPLQSVGEWMSGGTPSRSQKRYWNGSIPWASPKDMKTDILYETEESLTREGAENGARIIPKHTILMVVRGMILAHTFPVALTGRSMAFNQDMKALIVGPDFDAKYVFYWFQNSAGRILNIGSESSHGTRRIPSNMLFEMNIPRPPKQRQREIATIIERCDERSRETKAHIERLESLKTALLNTLI